MMHRILLVDDNLTLLVSLRRLLRAHYSVDIAQTGERALEMLSQSDYDCMILDLGLADMDGLEVCVRLRQSGNGMPVIVMSGESSVVRKAELLDAGADDYVIKPVNAIEIEARLRTAIRRSRPSQALASKLSIHGVVLDSRCHSVTRNGTPITLRPKEFSLLECLMNHAGQVVSRPALLRYAWDEHAEVWHTVVDVHIKYLRDKLDHPFEEPLIKTVHGLGYKFDASNVANTVEGGKRNERTITNRTH